MYKVVVLTDPNNADGFRLAGVEVYEAGNPLQAKEKLTELIFDSSVGIIAVNEKFIPFLDDKTREHVEKVYMPIIIALPIKDKLKVGEERRKFLSRLISRAIGFDITLGR